MRRVGWVLCCVGCLSTAKYEQAHEQRVAAIDERYETLRAETADRWNVLLRQVNELAKYEVAVRPGEGYAPVERVEEQPGPTTLRTKCDELATEAKSKELDSIAVEQFQALVKECWSKYYSEIYGPALRAHYYKADIQWVLAQYTEGADLESLFAFSHNATIASEVATERATVIAARDAALQRLQTEESEEVQMSAEQRDAEIERAREERRRTAAIVAASLQGLGQSLDAASQRRATYSATTSTSTNACSSDFECGSGHMCVKQNFSVTGTCVVSVNEYGNQTFQMPRLDSVYMNRLDMSCSRLGCPIAFRCDLNTGACLR